MGDDLRCILLMGGNSAGKTTVLNRAKQQCVDVPGWVWASADNDSVFKGLKGDISVQYRTLMRIWSDPAVRGIVLEGTRIYSTTFRCFFGARVRRSLVCGLMLRAPEICREQVRRRCAARGKRFREDYWSQERSVRYEAAERYERSWQRLQARTVGLPVTGEVFWIDLEYAMLDQVTAWIVDRVRAR